MVDGITRRTPHKKRVACLMSVLVVREHKLYNVDKVRC